ncbi:hypothetical protein QNN00_26530 [Bacillus velezensis]|nr:hypothetical protein [Bacillus velezensis]
MGRKNTISGSFKKQNENIDRGRSHLNYDLVNGQLIGYAQAVREKLRAGSNGKCGRCRFSERVFDYGQS